MSAHRASPVPAPPATREAGRKKVRHPGRPDPLETAALALRHRTGTLAGALLERFARLGTGRGATQLCQLYAARSIDTGSFGTERRRSVPLTLARRHDARQLAGALVGRLALDGRIYDATELARSFRAIDLGAQARSPSSGPSSSRRAKRALTCAESSEERLYRRIDQGQVDRPGEPRFTEGIALATRSEGPERRRDGCWGCGVRDVVLLAVAWSRGPRCTHCAEAGPPRGEAMRASLGPASHVLAATPDREVPTGPRRTALLRLGHDMRAMRQRLGLVDVDEGRRLFRKAAGRTQ